MVRAATSLVYAGLIHRFIEYVVEAHVLARLGNDQTLRISHDAEQLFRDRRYQNYSQILIDGDNAVLHLRHDDAQRMIMAALLENAALNAADDGVVFRDRVAGALNWLDTRVKIAVGEFIERVHDPVDQTRLGIDPEQHGNKRSEREHQYGANRYKCSLMRQRLHPVDFFC